MNLVSPTIGANQMIALYQRLELLLWRCLAVQGKVTNFQTGEEVSKIIRRCVEMRGDVRGRDLPAQWKRYIIDVSRVADAALPHFVKAVAPLVPHGEIVRNFLEHNIFQPFSENGYLMGMVSLKIL